MMPVSNVGFVAGALQEVPWGTVAARAEFIKTNDPVLHADLEGLWMSLNNTAEMLVGIRADGQLTYNEAVSIANSTYLTNPPADYSGSVADLATALNNNTEAVSTAYNAVLTLQALVEGLGASVSEAVAETLVEVASPTQTLIQALERIFSVASWIGMYGFERIGEAPNFITPGGSIYAFSRSHDDRFLGLETFSDSDIGEDETAVEALQRVFPDMGWQLGINDSILPGAYVSDGTYERTVYYCPLPPGERRIYEIVRALLWSEIPAILDQYGQYTPSSGPPDRNWWHDMRKLIALAPIVYNEP